MAAGFDEPISLPKEPKETQRLLDKKTNMVELIRKNDKLANSKNRIMLFPNVSFLHNSIIAY